MRRSRGSTRRSRSPIRPIFAPPDPSQLGDHHSCRLLRDAIRLGFRSSAGPFRSFGQIAVEPRSYQLVPLLMALKLDPIRLLDRRRRRHRQDDREPAGRARAARSRRDPPVRGPLPAPPRRAVAGELQDKFHIDAELVLPEHGRRLDGVCGNRSVFDVFDFTVVSTRLHQVRPPPPGFPARRVPSWSSSTRPTPAPTSPSQAGARPVASNETSSSSRSPARKGSILSW